MSPDDYEIGYKKPPPHGKFVPGHTRSRGRRTRKAQDVNTLILDEIASTIEIKEGVRTHKVTKLSALVKRLVAKALAGELKALALLLPLIRAAGGAEALMQAADGVTDMLQRNAASLLAALAADTEKED